MKYTKTYKEVLKWRGGALKRNVRDLALNLLSINAKVDKDFKGVQFLYFHYIYDDEIKNAEKIIGWIANNFKVISYSEATNRILNNDIDDYYICFSSDDGLKSNLIASRIFKKHNISCCFFINPETISNRDQAFHNKVCTERLGVPLTEVLTWEDVNQLVSDGHEIGNHSLDHKVQGELSPQEFEQDFIQSNKDLKQKLGDSIKHYAFPRGQFQYFKKEYLDKTYTMGYTSCATAVRGCHIEQPTSEFSKNIATRRDVVVFYEPLAYVKYFLSKAQKTAHINNTFWQQ
ncbi:polysaccharide deacetylase family protein [Olleya namhaensis]|uniref:polysaccharide deacetylase family protein n=1 Tax=Olleya namhaensis TaxID=1144750 RepID=UPI002490C973|nr:polysaccharide deacetylase family protein [Olleya namhaensis]